MTERIEKIKRMLQAEPDDAFLQYGLAMEFVSAQRYGEAVEAFRKCVELDDSNLPAHVEAAKAMRSAGDLKAAREMFAVAMELAAMQGESHVRDYIQQQLDGLPQ